MLAKEFEVVIEVQDADARILGGRRHREIGEGEVLL
jgi:hypothetical protein